MTLVEIYSKRECHLCDVAKNVVNRVRQQYPFELRLIDIQEGDSWYSQFKERVPVIYIDKKLAFQFHVPEQEFIAALNIASGTPGEQK